MAFTTGHVARSHLCQDFVTDRTVRPFLEHTGGGGFCVSLGGRGYCPTGAMVGFAIQAGYAGILPRCDPFSSPCCGTRAPSLLSRLAQTTGSYRRGRFL
jgi:hypothetical protein